VFLRAQALLHWRRKSQDQCQSRGSGLSLKRSAWSSRHSDLSRIPGALGEDQA
jgi:hypothetical protein